MRACFVTYAFALACGAEADPRRDGEARAVGELDAVAAIGGAVSGPDAEAGVEVGPDAQQPVDAAVPVPGDAEGYDASAADAEPTANVGVDLSPDLTTDLAEDVSPGVPPDLLPDLQREVSLDLSRDVTRDPPPDAPIDLAQDSAPDAPPDIGPDAPPPASDAPPAWLMVNAQARTVETPLIRYGYALGYLHDGDGMAIRPFVTKANSADHSRGLEGIWSPNKWDATPVTFDALSSFGTRVDIPVTTGLTKKIDRLYRDFPGIEIQYTQTSAMWIEDFAYVAGDDLDIAFVMHGLSPVVGRNAGYGLQNASRDRAMVKYGMWENYGDTFIEAAGSTVANCLYKEHFVFGFVNLRTGQGMGFVYPTSFTIKEWKVWYIEVNKLGWEFAPGGKVGKRWLFAVTQGRDEVMRVGKALVDNGGFK